MALSSCLFPPQFSASFRMNGCRLRSRENHVTGGCATKNGVNPRRRRNLGSRSCSAVVQASLVQSSSQIASSVFSWGTLAVLPLYALMVMAPRAELTKKVAASSVPYVLLSTLYAYLLYLSWTPDTIHFIFASKYWLPELPGIATMFSSEMTLASAWIHLMAVDLFAARQVYLEGLKESVETRHSVLLCLLFCPIGILTHVVTKAVSATKPENGMQ